MKNIFSSAMAFCLLLALNSCNKNNDAKCPQDFKVTANTLTPTVGENVVLTANLNKWNYRWSGPNNFFSEPGSGSNSVTISDIKINQAGWYTGSLMNSGCGVLVDSVYIDVKYKQGNPPCSLTNNTVSGSGLPDLQASSVIKSFSTTWNTMSLYASGTFGYPTYTFLFNSYNGRTEPKDGLYVTSDVQTFSVLQDANVLYGQCQYGSYFFKTQPGQTVYVSHVGGKLRISFCNLKMSGDNGNSVMVTSTFDGQVTEK